MQNLFDHFRMESVQGPGAIQDDLGHPSFVGQGPVYHFALDCQKKIYYSFKPKRGLSNSRILILYQSS